MKRVVIDGINHPYQTGHIVNFDGNFNSIEKIELIPVEGKADMTVLSLRPVMTFAIKSSDVLKVTSI